MIETGNEWDDPEATGRRLFLRKAFCFLGTAIVVPKLVVAAAEDVAPFAGLTFHGAPIFESQFPPLRSEFDLINEVFRTNPVLRVLKSGRPFIGGSI